MKQRDTLRSLSGLGLTGYGALTLLGVLAHDALVAGLLSLLLGLLLLLPGIGGKPEPATRHGSSAWPPVGADRRIDRVRAPADAPPGGGSDASGSGRRMRGLAVAVIGFFAVAGVLTYNLALGSQIGLPEWGILGYGALLLFASTRLDRQVGRFPVNTLVGWSFPVLLAPLLLFAVNAMLSGPASSDAGAAAQPVIIATLVVPMAAGLRMAGTPAEVVRDNVVLQTSSGSLSLGVGLVCAGLYPMVLFMGILGMHAWQRGLGKGRFAAYMGVGLVGLYVMNLLRLVMLAKIGQRWGGEALQTAHAHLGWILFAGFMAAFWGLVLRRIEAQPRRDATPVPDE